MTNKVSQFSGSKLRNMRKEKKLTQKDIARKLGVDTKYIREVELDRIKPRTEIVLWLSNLFNVQVNHFNF